MVVMTHTFAVAMYAMHGRGSGGPRRQWRAMKSGQSIRRRWWLESAMDATAVRAGTRAKMLRTTSSHMPGEAVLAPPVLIIFLVDASLGSAASSISSSSLAFFFAMLP